ncbi:hypothetical protein AMECASPLE_007943 [Ameca splendens]|uniref:Uncharacterized protein n=1 Tax=Ameca splendens TaxID=208324 RepID=A0ABV0ZVS1_9TELE
MFPHWDNSLNHKDRKKLFPSEKPIQSVCSFSQLIGRAQQQVREEQRWVLFPTYPGENSGHFHTFSAISSKRYLNCSNGVMEIVSLENELTATAFDPIKLIW